MKEVDVMEDVKVETIEIEVRKSTDKDVERFFKEEEEFKGWTDGIIRFVSEYNKLEDELNRKLEEFEKIKKELEKEVKIANIYDASDFIEVLIKKLRRLYELGIRPVSVKYRISYTSDSDEYISKKIHDVDRFLPGFMECLFKKLITMPINNSDAVYVSIIFDNFDFEFIKEQYTNDVAELVQRFRKLFSVSKQIDE